VLSAINTEAFGHDSKETLVSLIQRVLKDTGIPRLAFGSIHPWSLTKEFLKYYKSSLSHSKRFVQFFHVPIQSGSQTVLASMRREYDIEHVIQSLKQIQEAQPNALIATDIIVGFLGETEELFEQTYAFLEKSPISRFHVFRFSNRPHTAAFYLKNQLVEPTSGEKKNRSDRLIALSKKKYQSFLKTQIGRESDALVISPYRGGLKLLLDNHMEGIIPGKDGLPGQVLHVTIIAAKDGVVICKES
jgi:threonylcarbamoyladenosine tRNA methylthiotransferase MtaB